MVLAGFMLLPGCPCPCRCVQEDKATEVVRYTVHGIDLDQPFADSVRDSWRWAVIAFEDMLDWADWSGAQLLNSSEVPAPPVEEAHTLTGYWLITDGQVTVRYQAPEKITDGARAYRLYEQTTVADGDHASTTVAVWDYVLDVPGPNDDSAILDHFVSYTVFGTSTMGPRTVSSSARMRVAASDLRETVAAAAEDLSGATLLADNDVPVPSDENLMRCSVCAYTKMVNFVVEDYGGDPFKPGCGACGVRTESHTVVIDGVVVADVVQAWDFRY